jgi:DNA-binding Xre family transcriptional regulator
MNPAQIIDKYISLAGSDGIFTHADLAKKAGISPSSLSRMYRLHNLCRRIRYKVAQVINTRVPCEPDDLINLCDHDD